MEEQDRSAIAARHPHHKRARTGTPKDLPWPTDQQAPGVETAARPNRLRCEDDTGLPGFELEVHDHLDPLIADETTQTGDATMLGGSIVPRAWSLNPRQTNQQFVPTRIANLLARSEMPSDRPSCALTGARHLSLILNETRPGSEQPPSS